MCSVSFPHSPKAGRGAGLLVQRVLTSTVLLYFGTMQILQHDTSGLRAAYTMAAGAGIFLFLGLWTPFAGITIAVVEVWIFLACSGSSLAPIMLAGLGATVAMIGPGMWSIDSKLYGRKLLEDPRH
jgi:putative oxidoreductase